MCLLIRVMCAGDAPAVCSIFVTSLGYDDCTTDVVGRQIERLAADPQHIALVWTDEETGKVQGFIHAERYDTLHNVGGWNVIALAVALDAQGRGIGRALLSACEAKAKARGGTFVRLNSSIKRTGAHRFYEQVGYESNKTQKHFIKRLI